MSVKVIAHRGANKKAPQNTMPAFIQAVKDKADGFETDVHLTRDGELVICHNYTIDEMSDGTGFIRDYTLAEMKKFDFGSYFADEFKNTPCPTLEEFLDFAGASEAEIINIELKCPDNGLYELTEKTVRAVQRHGLIDRVIISSFSPKILRAVKECDPCVKTGFLFPTNRPAICRPVFLNPYMIAASVKADALHPMAPLVSRAMVEIAHKMGMKVNVWTVNDRATVAKLVADGVDGIITDCPGEVRLMLEKKNRKKAEPEKGTN